MLWEARNSQIWQIGASFSLLLADRACSCHGMLFVDDMDTHMLLVGSMHLLGMARLYSCHMCRSLWVRYCQIRTR